MARNNLTSGSEATVSAAYVTAQITPGQDRLILAFVMNLSQGAAPAATPALQGNGVTWDLVASQAVAGNADRRISCFRSLNSPTPGTVTISFGGQNQARCAWSIFEYDDINTAGANGIGAVLQPANASGSGTNAAINLGPLVDAARSIVVGGIVIALDNQPGKSIDPGMGLTEVHELPMGNNTGRGGTLQTEDRLGGGQQVNWSWTGVESFAAIAFEVRAADVVIAPTPENAEALAKRFEPILFFHPQERFFPSDAKRYLESCALWQAEAPFDQKGSWGGTAAPFPRQPLIAKGGMAAIPNEPGVLLGSAPNHMIDSPTEERFLELAAWKNAANAPQPDVTQATQNTYAEREVIAKQYTDDDANGGVKRLRESRFRYHAELFDTDRLRRLLTTVREPDLVKVLDGFKNPALLCYYFFYPAREEPLGTTCTGIEAQEFASFGGEWSCMALLLERNDLSGQFAPSFIGCTGRFLPPDPNGVVRPQAHDTDDAARRIVMKLAPFAGPVPNPAPGKEGEHPRLFVAKGTHSLYFDSGTVGTTFMQGLWPTHCGKFDTPGVAPEPEKPWNEDPTVMWIKIIAGGYFIFTLSIVWAMLEAGAGGLNTTGVLAPPANDEIAPAGGGKTIKPATVNVPDAGPNVSDWLSAQGEEFESRKYNFIVDRERQAWWPKDAGDGGYRGRWGPRVENDPLGRRAGMRFPTFWRMFFLALAQGKTTGTL